MSIPGGVGMPSDEQDEAYIRKAVAMGAKYIILRTMPHFLGIPLRIACPMNSWIAILRH